MLGSTFIHEADPRRLHVLRRNVDALDRFVTLALDRMTTLDFEMNIAAKGVPWSADEPVFFDEAAGVALMPVTQEGLQAVWALDPASLPEHADDVRALQGFLRQHGTKNVYELATF